MLLYRLDTRRLRNLFKVIQLQRKGIKPNLSFHSTTKTRGQKDLDLIQNSQYDFQQVDGLPKPLFRK